MLDVACRAETSEQAAQGGKSKKAQKTSPRLPPSGQGRAGPSKAPEVTPAAPAKAPRKAPPAKTPAAAAKKAPAKGPSKVPRARAAGVQKRPARQPGSRRKERPQSFKVSTACLRTWKHLKNVIYNASFPDAVLVKFPSWAKNSTSGVGSAHCLFQTCVKSNLVAGRCTCNVC